MSAKAKNIRQHLKLYLQIETASRKIANLSLDPFVNWVEIDCSGSYT